MRSVRELIHRASLDAREAALLRSMALETVHFLNRRQVEVELPEHLREIGRLSGGEASMEERPEPEE
jgi:hypothetical protein